MKEEVAHTTKYASLIALCKDLGCQELHELHAENAKYTSQRILRDHAKAVSTVLLTDVIKEMQKSGMYSIMIDETTDITTTKQMVVYAKYFNSKSGMEETAFLGILPLPGNSFSVKVGLHEFRLFHIFLISGNFTCISHNTKLFVYLIYCLCYIMAFPFY